VSPSDWLKQGRIPGKRTVTSYLCAIATRFQNLLSKSGSGSPINLAVGECSSGDDASRPGMFVWWTESEFLVTDSPNWDTTSGSVPSCRLALLRIFWASMVDFMGAQ